MTYQTKKRTSGAPHNGQRQWLGIYAKFVSLVEPVKFFRGENPYKQAIQDGRDPKQQKNNQKCSYAAHDAKTRAPIDI
jgi:hypothetical protein